MKDSYMWRVINNEKGLALLITLMAISLLIVITLRINSISREEYIAGANYRDKVELDGIVISGINIAEATLEADLEDNSYDSYFDSWAQLTREVLPPLFIRGILKLEIEDLSGRLQVNSLVNKAPDPEDEDTQLVGSRSREILMRLLMSEAFGIEDESRVQEIVDAITDWIDKDDRESDFGAEDSYYQSLDPPYNCKNAPLEFVEELLLVKGITAELLYGDEKRKGLADVITVHGDDGKININSAVSLVLRALDSRMSPELADSIMEYREDEGNKDNLEAANWYMDIDGWPGDIELDKKLVTTTSRYFRIRATGSIGSLTKIMRETVLRDVKGEEVITRLISKVE